MNIFVHLFLLGVFFTLAILVGYSALCRRACGRPGGSCVGPAAGASDPETSARRCFWGRCCGNSLESHVRGLAGSLSIPSPLLCRGPFPPCLQGCCCWSTAPPTYSHAAHATAGLTWSLRMPRRGLQEGGPWVAVGTPQHS